jgi:hypothetical protein
MIRKDFPVKSKMNNTAVLFLAIELFFGAFASFAQTSLEDIRDAVITALGKDIEINCTIGAGGQATNWLKARERTVSLPPCPYWTQQPPPLPESGCYISAQRRQFLKMISVSSIYTDRIGSTQSILTFQDFLLT